MTILQHGNWNGCHSNVLDHALRWHVRGATFGRDALAPFPGSEVWATRISAGDVFE